MSVAVAAPAVTSVEWLRFRPESTRSRVFFDALVRSADAVDVHVTTTDKYRAGSDWLMVWGGGAPDRFEPMRRQLLRGGHVLCFDLAYWSRTAKVRVSIDGPHPQAWVMKTDLPTTRWEADPAPVGDAWNPEGPVLVAGVGRKASIQYGSIVDTWEAQRIRECQAAGHRPILYRHKREHGAIPDGTTRAPASPIDDVLKGVSLVVTWHSNVAVDAIRLGIPVVCQDGAAAAVCPTTVPPVIRPLPTHLRDRFLSNLAWFQWRGDEGHAAWTFLRELLA